MWADKYRPASLDDVVTASQPLMDLVHNIKTFFGTGDRRELTTHFIFHGHTGVGKTTLALLLARHMCVAQGVSPREWVLHHTACTDRGIASMRSFVETSDMRPIASFSAADAAGHRLAPPDPRSPDPRSPDPRSPDLRSPDRLLRFIVLDEADKLTRPAQELLRAEMEKPRTLFFLLTNRLESITPALQSRCVSFLFPAIPPPKIAQRLAYIAAANSVDPALLPPPVAECVPVTEIAAACGGDLRAAVNLLQQYVALATVKPGATVFDVLQKPPPHLKLPFSELRLYGFRDVVAAVAAVAPMELLPDLAQLEREALDAEPSVCQWSALQVFYERLHS